MLAIGQSSIFESIVQSRKLQSSINSAVFTSGPVMLQVHVVGVHTIILL